ncbi:uncharacterized protein LOC131693220 [Topomyia yanbarensis]|uniref:uncharacterized protein LOC131693220 n=1 Tax=Topomyia yanbarensis TaxID=2498891 RepID=UPI00273C3683|nr:uncharacterized protein LOC131693220 [Topomyia yanbarensis]
MATQITPLPESLYERFSSFWRLVRVTAYILRFINNCKSKNKRESFLTVTELEEAKEALAKGVQQEVFQSELTALRKKLPLPVGSALKFSRPFLDRKGIIRCGGRLELSDESYKTKHPIILPNKHQLSRLIATYYHNLSLHSGPRMTLASIRQEFWPLRGKTLANFVCRKCSNCFRLNPVPITQPEGQLPKSRTAPSRPFAITGVDFCGPVYLKPVHRRAAAQKAYIAVFVCFTTKATHLELVCDLSTNAFIAALHRFVARRGVPAEIHSDNGTNFKGAKNVLNELYYMLNNHQEAIVNECTAKGITWKFIPPRAPNFGGLWEAAVKTAKTSMVKTIGNTSLSYEDFLTVLTQIEANMNARPLTPLSDDPTELDVLTPSHFLTGSSSTSLPDPDYTKVPSNRLKHYQQLQQLIQKHWIRWRNEYLTELNVQRKKSPATMHVRVGQIVLVHDESKPSIAWPLARIEAITPGQDNIVRVATVRTKSGIYTRPVRKLYPLPFCSEADIKQNEHNTEAVVTEICS